MAMHVGEADGREEVGPVVTWAFLLLTRSVASLLWWSRGLSPHKFAETVSLHEVQSFSVSERCLGLGPWCRRP